jgi:hypothetical protein
VELNLSIQDLFDTFYLYLKYIFTRYDVWGVELRGKPPVVIRDTFEDQ